MRVLVTGGAGLLGSELLAAAPAGVEVVATVLDRPAATGVAVERVDLCDAGAVQAVVGRVRPDVVVHTAYRRDDGERHVVGATANVAAAAAAVGAGLVHLSSDVVFDGEHAPYGEYDECRPVHAYGRQKLAAEFVVADALPDAAIVRTSLIVRFEPVDSVTGWLVGAARRGEPVMLFDDEWRRPVFADDLAAMLWELVSFDRAQRSGPWHLVGPEALTRVELGERIAARFELDRSLLAAVPSPVTTGEEGRPRDLRLRDDRARAALRHVPRPIH